MFLWVVMLWALLPQLACFLPEAKANESEAACCEQMPEHCGQQQTPPEHSSTHTCCRHILASYVVATIKVQPEIDPPLELPAAISPAVELVFIPEAGGWHKFFLPNFHAPPSGLNPPLNLRI